MNSCKAIYIYEQTYLCYGSSKLLQVRVSPELLGETDQDVDELYTSQFQEAAIINKYIH